MNWFMQALKRTFTYRGRARRAEFGWFNLIAILVNLALNIIPLILFGLGGSLLEEVYQSSMLKTASGIGIILFVVIGYLFNFVTTFTQLSLTARRLHDLGYSGWWQLAVYLGLPFLVILLVELNLPDTVVGFTAIFCVFIFFAYICMLFFKDGQRFDNKYGEDPKAEKIEPMVQDKQNQAETTLPTKSSDEEVSETDALIEDNNKPRVTFSHIAKK